MIVRLSREISSSIRVAVDVISASGEGVIVKLTSVRGPVRESPSFSVVTPATFSSTVPLKFSGATMDTFEMSLAETIQTRSVPVPETTIVAPVSEKFSARPVMRSVVTSDPSVSGDATSVMMLDS